MRKRSQSGAGGCHGTRGVCIDVGQNKVVDHISIVPIKILLNIVLLLSCRGTGRCFFFWSKTGTFPFTL
ncbi:hypothetical protein OWV82_013343 [Melia azedarach]|uniref:Uncharacterized protein n=1 Tax=Melia azedarach TaxID=155640 RepID=A0ACC1XXB9_MELAZ|nr:hypothetical protein OWV82_013343 [Melia azedarach]